MRILFVDDDPDTRALAVRAVMQEFPIGESAEATDRGTLNEALASGPVDVLVADYDLRWIDGFEVYELTKFAHPDCVAVMFTGTGSEELAVRAMKLGFDDYVVKAPGQLKRLASSTRLAFERHAERRLLRDNRELLRQELYHRLHNNLQIVISLMGRTARSIDDPAAKAQVRDLMRRIQSLSLLQERFYRTDDLRRVDVAEFVEELAGDLRNATPAAIISTKIEPLFVPVDQAVPLGLIANEMMMNALGSEPAEARVSVVLRQSQGRGELAVAAQSRSDHPTKQRQMSADLIARLAEQIGAEIDVDSTDGAAAMRVTFNLS